MNDRLHRFAKRLPPARVLIVEDDQEQAEYVSAIVEGSGADAIVVHHPQQACDLLETETFDVVVTDHEMPGMTGLQLLCRARHVQPDALRIMLTSTRDYELVTRAINAGEVFRFLNKPLGVAELDVVMRTAYQRRKARRTGLTRMFST